MKITIESTTMSEPDPKDLELAKRIARSHFVIIESDQGTGYEHMLTNVEKQRIIAALRRPATMPSEDCEHNSLGEIVIPVYLNGISEVRAKLSENAQLFLDAFEHIAGREGLILRVLDSYLRALPPAHVKTLIPVLLALSEQKTPAPAHDKEEGGWLIERAYVKPEMTHYFGFEILTRHGFTIKHWGWFSDIGRATRFARKMDAELAWQCVTQRALDDIEIHEHAWSGLSTHDKEEGK